MRSWQQESFAAFVLCLAGCAAPQSTGGAGAAEAARASNVVAAPGGSFRATLGSTDALSEALMRELAAAESTSVRRGSALEAGVPERGDTVLVDVTSYNGAHQEIERVHAFGVLRSRDGDNWSIVDRRTHRLLVVRLSEGSWVRAPRGEYRLRTTGEVVGQPAYYVRLERYASLPATGRIVEY